MKQADKVNTHHAHLHLLSLTTLNNMLECFFFMLCGDLWLAAAWHLHVPAGVNRSQSMWSCLCGLWGSEITISCLIACSSLLEETPHNKSKTAANAIKKKRKTEQYQVQRLGVCAEIKVKTLTAEDWRGVLRVTPSSHRSSSSSFISAPGGEVAGGGAAGHATEAWWLFTPWLSVGTRGSSVPRDPHWLL